MTSVLIKNTQIVVADNDLMRQDVLVVDGVIEKVATNITETTDRVIDANGALMTPVHYKSFIYMFMPY